MKARAVLSLAGIALACAVAASAASGGNVTVNAHLAQHASKPGAVMWLEPAGHAPVATPAHGHFELVQKDKQFSPHLLVIPVGSAVSFPNRDPFFHNVFSYFNGSRFDLGLYEAGSTRSVSFNRPGVSYIFCNIHPDMSAVIIALATPYFSVADAGGKFLLRDVPAGDYRLHVWVDGADLISPPPAVVVVHISRDHADLGELELPNAPAFSPHHQNKFGNPYPPPVASPY